MTTHIGKRGLELSINTLVVLILGILVLGGGFLLVKNLTDDAQDIVRAVGTSTKAKIDEELKTGLISIPHNTRVSSEYGRQHFALGFVNKLTTHHEFMPSFAFKQAFTEDGTEITPFDGDALLFHRTFDSTNHFPLAPNEVVNDVAFSITIPSGNPKGTYVYEVTIYYDKVTSGEILKETDYEYAKKQVRITLD